ncbi:hypothetical protein CC1G_04879 [Coprinopsis cinerea okayama7|uniref:Uncharacterized protein n=1 Tax=Coprinopsis cinerea (strain Okayama-7 / 130 / ATCC MYA-4618 / FGSC 9003) TaxID=240176 RepID=A8PFW9_COPC7|nr:hypothetical protein CC1G_04879 [Coprinopsis cinerea okayama7\|eukprot:XP_001841035.1 hypothetical protein CC1G_04879 [Coprinopsis cinerea okayama7\
MSETSDTTPPITTSDGPTSDTPTSTPTPPPPPTSTPSEPPTSTPTPTSTQTDDEDDDDESSTEPPSSSSTPTSSSTTPTLTSSSTTPTLTPTSADTDTTSSTPNVVTSFQTVTRSRSIVPSATLEPSSDGKGFFQNTGAVAGVFSVVGLIVLAIIIAVVTNGIRRRRAKKFDREIAEAAREAAAAQPPAGFLDDDDDYNRGYGNNTSGGAAGYGAYSDASSHGTYAQSPMSHAESYGMREIGRGPAPGEVFDYGATGAGNAGIGVARARSMRHGDNYGQALQDGGSPYPAFAAPSHQQPAYGRPNDHDILEAAGMGAHVAGAGAAGLARGPSQYQSQSSSGYDQGYNPTLERNKSLTSHESTSQYSGVPSTTASQYYNSRHDNYGPYPAMPPNASSAYQQGYPAGASTHQRQPSMPDNEMDAYGGYVVSDDAPASAPNPPVSAASASTPLPNPFDQAKAGERDTTYSVDDDEPRRVLKVANE